MGRAAHAANHRPDGHSPGLERPSAQPFRLDMADQLLVCPAGIPGPQGPSSGASMATEVHGSRRLTHWQSFSFPLAGVPECIAQPGLRTHSCHKAGCPGGRSSAHTHSELGTSESPDGGNETGIASCVVPCLARIRARPAKSRALAFPASPGSPPWRVPRGVRLPHRTGQPAQDRRRMIDL